MSYATDGGADRRSVATGLETVPWDQIVAAVRERLRAKGVEPVATRAWSEDLVTTEQLVSQQLLELRQHLLGQDDGARDGSGVWDMEIGDPWTIWLALVEVLLDSPALGIPVHQGQALIGEWARLATARGQELASLAFHDGVAGCANRRATARRLAYLVRRKKPFLVIFADLDHFKTINDIFGHGAGDVVLRTMAERWRQLLRPGDWLGRWGGDEFLLLIHDHLTRDAVDRIRYRLARTTEEPVAVEGCPAIAVSASFGSAWYPDDGTTAEAVLAVADQRLYRAKDQDAIPSSLTTASRDHRDPDLGPIEVHYQPILSFEAPVVERWEALVRYRTAAGRLLEARDFLRTWPHAAVATLDRYVLTTVFNDLLQWERQGHALSVAVNVAPQSLVSPDWQADLDRWHHAHPAIAPQRISIEIAESDAFRDSGDLWQAVARLSHLGHPVSLDHFGTGRVALGELPRWPVTSIKIDRLVTMRWQLDEGRAVIQSVVGLSRPLGVRVVAEGVESLAQSRAVRDWGCHAGQGWWQTSAVPAHRVPLWMPR